MVSHSTSSGMTEDSEGIAIDVDLEKNPVFAEAYFEGSLADANLMMEINGQWFYKAPGGRCGSSARSFI